MSGLISLSEALSDAEVFTDGDWVESKDQDPDGDVRLTQLADVGDGLWVNKSSRFLTSEKAKQLRCTYLEAGDLLIARMPDPLGRCCIFPGDPMPCVTVVDVCVVRPNPKRVDTDYLKHIINSPRGRHEIAQHVTGTTRQRISRKNLGKIEIPLPPLTEQKRIAGILDAADALRAKRRAALAELDALLQSTFLDMFGDPVTNPMGWRVVQFGEVSHSRLGKMLDAKQQTGKHVRPYLANANVQWGHFVFDDLREMDFNENDRQEFRLQYGDLLICEGGEVGRTAIWREQMDEVYFQKALHRCRLDSRLAKPEYMQYYMWFMSKHGGFKDFTTVATIAHLTGVKLKKLPVPLPPLALQGRFAVIFESVELQKERMNTHQTELDALFASLQSRAFNGEL